MKSLTKAGLFYFKYLPNFFILIIQNASDFFRE